MMSKKKKKENNEKNQNQNNNKTKINNKNKDDHATRNVQGSLAFLRRWCRPPGSARQCNSRPRPGRCRCIQTTAGPTDGSERSREGQH